MAKTPDKQGSKSPTPAGKPGKGDKPSKAPNQPPVPPSMPPAAPGKG
jgi:hypothetical protein